MLACLLQNRAGHFGATVSALTVSALALYAAVARQRYTAILITLHVHREISIFLFADDVTPFLQLTD